eukprot:ANDGO_03035.mRNA.1 hypothetical protein NAEGRDRAFT_57308
MDAELDWVIAGRDYDVDKWYEAVEHLTPKTVFMDLTGTDVDCILEFYRTEFGLKSAMEDADRVKGFVEHGLSDLASRIARVLNDYSEQKQWFVRLSCRSPKDGIPLHGIVKYADTAKDLGLDPETVDRSNPDTANSIFVRMLKQRSAALCVSSALEILHLTCTSERVNRDLVKSKEHGLSTQLILRAWNKQIDEAWEFRCFVHDKQLTAISQYNQYCFYEDLQDQEMVVREGIRMFYEKHKNEIPYDNCVMDVALLPRRDSSGFIATIALQIIEFNPFDRFTGASLFDWTVDRDVLTSGPLCVRIRKQPMENIEQLVEIWAETSEEPRLLKQEALLKTCCGKPAAAKKCTIM